MDAVPHPAGPASGRVVLVPVAAIDRRAIAAARYATLVPAGERRAVHVTGDRRAGEMLSLEWMYAPPGGLPLDVVDDRGGVPATVGKVVGDWLASGATDVVVLLGQLSMRWLGRRLLHDSTALAISSAVARLPRTVPVLISVGCRDHPAGWRDQRSDLVTMPDHDEHRLG